jgi:hypothetical protein
VSAALLPGIGWFAGPAGALRGEHRLKSQNLLPKRVVNYIHEIGERTLDHLAEHPRVPKAKGSNGASAAVQSLIDQWKSMTPKDREDLVNRISDSVIEVVAASAMLPLGLKLGKRAKVTKKILERRAKELRKVTRRASAAGSPKKKNKEKAKDKTKDKAKRKKKG